jgi:hypothetical protein
MFFSESVSVESMLGTQTRQQHRLGNRYAIFTFQPPCDGHLPLSEGEFLSPHAASDSNTSTSPGEYDVTGLFQQLLSLTGATKK